LAGVESSRKNRGPQKRRSALPSKVRAAKEAGELFHPYSTYVRGLDILLGAYNFIDLTPKGRNEEGLLGFRRVIVVADCRRNR